MITLTVRIKLPFQQNKNKKVLKDRKTERHKDRKTERQKKHTKTKTKRHKKMKASFCLFVFLLAQNDLVKGLWIPVQEETVQHEARTNVEPVRDQHGARTNLELKPDHLPRQSKIRPVSETDLKMEPVDQKVRIDMSPELATVRQKVRIDLSPEHEEPVQHEARINVEPERLQHETRLSMEPKPDQSSIKPEHKTDLNLEAVRQKVRIGLSSENITVHQKVETNPERIADHQSSIRPEYELELNLEPVRQKVRIDLSPENCLFGFLTDGPISCSSIAEKCNVR